MRRYLIPSLLTAAAASLLAPRAAAAEPEHTEYHFGYSSDHGKLGVSVVAMTSELRAHFGAPPDRGVLVEHVDEGSVAADAGVKVGDVLVAVDGRSASNAFDLLNATDRAHKGSSVALDVVRDGRTLTLQVLLPADPWQ